MSEALIFVIKIKFVWFIMVSKETETEYNEQGFEEALQNQSKEALE